MLRVKNYMVNAARFHFSSTVEMEATLEAYEMAFLTDDHTALLAFMSEDET